MKNLKKLGIILTALLLVFTISGCGKGNDANISGTLEEIMEKLYADIPEDERPIFLENIEVNDENIESFIGTSNVKYEEIIASESMTGSTAHSVVLIRLKDGEDVEKVKSEIKEKVDPRKWICVGIERDEVVIKSRGNLVLVEIIQDEVNRAKIEKAFKNL